MFMHLYTLTSECPLERDRKFVSRSGYFLTRNHHGIKTLLWKHVQHTPTRNNLRTGTVIEQSVGTSKVIQVQPGGGALNFIFGRYVWCRAQKWGSKELIFCESKAYGTENFQHFEGLWTEIWAKFRLQSWKFFKFLTNLSRMSQNLIFLLKSGGLKNWFMLQLGI